MLQNPSNTAGHSDQVHLLRLPGEVRNRIYDYLYHDDNIPQPYQDPFYGIIPPSRSLQLQLLLTCRQVYREARLIAFTSVRFVLESNDIPIRDRIAVLEDDQIESIKHIELATYFRDPFLSQRRRDTAAYTGSGTSLVVPWIKDCALNLPGLDSISIHHGVETVTSGSLSTYLNRALGSERTEDASSPVYLYNYSFPTDDTISSGGLRIQKADGATREIRITSRMVDIAEIDSVRDAFYDTIDGTYSFPSAPASSCKNWLVGSLETDLMRLRVIPALEIKSTRAAFIRWIFHDVRNA